MLSNLGPGFLIAACRDGAETSLIGTVCPNPVLFNKISAGAAEASQ